LGAHWDSLDDDNPAKVKTANRWRRNLKPNTQPADLPEVDVRLMDGGFNKPFATNTSGQFGRVWQLGIATDDHASTDDSFDQSEWELVKVAAKAAIELLSLPGLVLSVNVVASSQTKDDGELSRSHKTWSGTVDLEITFQVPRADIIPTI
jgi:hypothetical protein